MLVQNGFMLIVARYIFKIYFLGSFALAFFQLALLGGVGMGLGLFVSSLVDS